MAFAYVVFAGFWARRWLRCWRIKGRFEPSPWGTRFSDKPQRIDEVPPTQQAQREECLWLSMGGMPQEWQFDILYWQKWWSIVRFAYPFSKTVINNLCYNRTYIDNLFMYIQVDLFPTTKRPLLAPNHAVKKASNLRSCWERIHQPVNVFLVCYHIYHTIPSLVCNAASFFGS